MKLPLVFYLFCTNKLALLIFAMNWSSRSSPPEAKQMPHHALRLSHLWNYKPKLTSFLHNPPHLWHSVMATENRLKERSSAYCSSCCLSININTSCPYPHPHWFPTQRGHLLSLSEVCISIWQLYLLSADYVPGQTLCNDLPISAFHESFGVGTI